MNRTIAILMILAVLIGCREKKEDELSYWLALAAAGGIGWNDSECREWSGARNGVYNAGGYEYRFATDMFDRDAVVIGNSTMDLTNRYVRDDGPWVSAGTRNVAVSGNTLCDMTEQSSSWPKSEIEFVLISTAGGNDVLRGIPVDRVVDNGRLLLERVRAVYPAAFICLTDIHPTRVSSANAVKDEVNERIANYLDGNGARVNVLGVFGKSEGEPSDPSQMYPHDGIHYNEVTAWRIRELIKDVCGRYP